MEYKDLSPATVSEEKLRLLITQKEFTGKTFLPAERTLGTELGVSRTTLRRSLEMLEKEGIIKKSNRKGMEVNTKQVINMLAMNSMTSQLEKEPQKQTITVLENKVIAGITEVNNFLQRDPEKPLFKLARKRFLNNMPFMYEISYLAPENFEDLREINFTNQSLYSVLQKQFQIFPTYGREEIRFVAANEKQANILDIPVDTPLFEVVSKAFDQNDIPVEYSKQYLIGKQVIYKINAKNIFDYREDEDEQ